MFDIKTRCSKRQFEYSTLKVLFNYLARLMPTNIYKKGFYMQEISSIGIIYKKHLFINFWLKIYCNSDSSITTLLRKKQIYQIKKLTSDCIWFLLK